MNLWCHPAASLDDWNVYLSSVLLAGQVIIHQVFVILLYNKMGDDSYAAETCQLMYAKARVGPLRSTSFLTHASAAL